MREWERSTNEAREKVDQMRVRPKELHKVARRARKAAEKQVVADMQPTRAS